jgi:hypothetical protein
MADKPRHEGTKERNGLAAFVLSLKKTWWLRVLVVIRFPGFQPKPFRGGGWLMVSVKKEGEQGQNDQDEGGDPPEGRDGFFGFFGSEFFGEEFVVVEGIVRKIETVFMAVVFPAGTVIRAAGGAGFGAAMDTGTAHRAITGRFEHGLRLTTKTRRSPRFSMTGKF